MVLIGVGGREAFLGENYALFTNLQGQSGGRVAVGAESTRLFDVCNAFIDATKNVAPSSDAEIDTAVFDLIRRGAIPQVPELKHGEIVEFIQKISHALSSTPRLVILHELHVRPMMRATVALLEMVTGIASQTLRRHLAILVNCRLVTRVRVGQTYLYESAPMRLAALCYLWDVLTKVEA